MGCCFHDKSAQGAEDGAALDPEIVGVVGPRDRQPCHQPATRRRQRVGHPEWDEPVGAAVDE